MSGPFIRGRAGRDFTGLEIFRARRGSGNGAPPAPPVACPRRVGCVNDFQQDALRSLRSFGYLLHSSVVGFSRAGGRPAPKRAGSLSSLSDRDPVTNLVDARAFRSHYARARAHALGSASDSLLLLDVDGLKILNDEFGHSFGSATLFASQRCSKLEARRRRRSPLGGRRVPSSRCRGGAGSRRSATPETILQRLL